MTVGGGIIPWFEAHKLVSDYDNIICLSNLLYEPNSSHICLVAQTQSSQQENV